MAKAQREGPRLVGEGGLPGSCSGFPPVGRKSPLRLWGGVGGWITVLWAGGGSLCDGVVKLHVSSPVCGLFKSRNGPCAAASSPPPRPDRQLLAARTPQNFCPQTPPIAFFFFFSFFSLPFPRVRACESGEWRVGGGGGGAQKTRTAGRARASAPQHLD